jgi:hypothetical protein
MQAAQYGAGAYSRSLSLLMSCPPSLPNTKLSYSVKPKIADGILAEHANRIGRPDLT